MGGLITNIFQFFIPPSVPDDAESQRKARITVAVLMIIILFNLNYYVISYLIGFTGGVLSQFPVMIVGMTILLLYRLSVNAEWLYLIYFICQPVAIAVAVYYTGGFSSVLFPWLAATPIVAVLIWSKVGGWFTISLVIAIELFFFYLYGVSHVAPNQINPEYQKIFYLACNLGLPVILFLVAIVFENARQDALVNLTEAMNELEREKQKSEKLILNILPEKIAHELKLRGEATATEFESVTVLFADFKDFTTMIQKMEPDALVAEIHHCFSAFDAIIDTYGMEKIKTIGDAYLAVSGLPTPSHRHARLAVQAALDIRDFMETYRAERQQANRVFFQSRIGLHSGSVIAGIVGRKKFQYDIWGDTVNTASRVESASEPGKINISSSTYQLVQNEFICSSRGKINTKGKGEIDMYFVEQFKSG